MALLGYMLEYLETSTFHGESTLLHVGAVGSEFSSILLKLGISDTLLGSSSATLFDAAESHESDNEKETAKSTACNANLGGLR